jgi:RNA polymerase sigma-70 factor (ECF subfamily)
MGHADKPYDEPKVLELLAQGSEYAFTQLFDHYRPRLYHAALKYLKSQELAEEIVQEVFLKVWQKRGEIGHVLNFNAYLFTVTRNLVFDCIKKMAEETTAMQEFSFGFTHEETTEKKLLEKQYDENLRKEVVKLPPQKKKIFKLAKSDGLSQEAIAAKLKISRLTVTAHMRQALQFIRMRLERHLN